jgi:pimeloyl-ACP methyl ester carboxylesterase
MHIELPTKFGTVWAATGGKPFDPALPAVVFLHGAGLDHTAWTQQSRWFAHHGRSVLALDLPGHGRSTGAPLTTIGALAELVIQVLDAAGLRTAALVGHSLGSLIALETAARYGGRVRALGLVGAAATIPVNPTLLQAARTDLPAAIAMIVGWGYGPRASLGPSPTPGLSLLGIGRQQLARAGAGVLAADLTACQDYADGLEAGNRVWCPTYLVLGELDRMTPVSCGEKLAAAIPDARKIVLPAVGHMIPMEAPEAVLEALARLT